MRTKRDFFDRIEMPIKKWVSHHDFIMSCLYTIGVLFSVWVMISIYITLLFGVVGVSQINEMMNQEHNNFIDCSFLYTWHHISDYEYNGW